MHEPPNTSPDASHSQPTLNESELFELGSLSAALSKAGDLRALCGDLALRVARLAKLDDCVVYVLQGNLLVRSSQWGGDGDDIEPDRLFDRVAQPLGSGVVGIAGVRRSPVYVSDEHIDADVPLSIKEGHSEYAVPMIHNGELVGVIDSERRRPGGFSPGCRLLMRAATDVAALFVAAHRGSSVVPTSNALSGVVAELVEMPAFASGNYAEGIALLVERAASVLRVSNVGVWLLEGDALTLVDLYQFGEDRHFREGRQGAGVLDWYTGRGAEHRSLVVGDTASDPNSRYLLEPGCADETVSAIHAPIRSAGELRGMLCINVAGRRRLWTDAEIRFAATIADIAALGLMSILNARAEAALIQAQRLESLGLLAGGVAHDFNNLLTVINGGVGLVLQDDSAHTEAQKRLLLMVEQAGVRAQKLTRQLLAFGKKQRLAMQVMDARELLNYALSSGRGAIREDIQVSITLPDTPCWVECDKDQIDQTLLNLLINAVDAMPIGGVLRLSVHAAAGEVVCRVADSGSGVPHELQQRIFEPFFTTKGEQGSGLGLSVGYGIVQQHGGVLRLRTEADSDLGGAVFEVCLPEQPAPAFETGDIRVSEPNSAGLIGGRVLLVEDEQDVRFVVERMLTRLGFDAIVARDGADALRLLRERRIDVLVTDVVMPDIRGPELYALACEERPDLKVLFMSGYSESSLVDVPESKESVRYLNKPFSLQTLESVLFEFFERESDRSSITVEKFVGDAE